MGGGSDHREPLTVVFIDGSKVFVSVFNLQRKLVFSSQFLGCLSEESNPKTNKTSELESPSPGRSPASEHWMLLEWYSEGPQSLQGAQKLCAPQAQQAML